VRTIVTAADRAVTALYARHYRPLVRLAVLLVWDLPVAEEIVQDSFVALHRARRRLGDSDRAVSYLYRSVVNRSRLVMRRRVTASGHTPMLPSGPAAQQDTVQQDTGQQDRVQQDTGQLDPAALAMALRALPGHHREALVLRYYADLPESQIGAALGISTAAVSRRLAQAIASLHAVLPTADSVATSFLTSRKDPQQVLSG
jgi:RNA polymerase sigma factor (sigma-70 family)